MSKYISNNELETFDFEEAVIGEIRLMNGGFFMYLDNVKILPDNSHNRDIRIMRANELEFSISNATINQFVEEGYKVYDADGKLTSTVNDREISSEEYKEEFDKLSECTLYSITKKDGIYKIEIDTVDHTYALIVSGENDSVKWDRFLNL